MTHSKSINFFLLLLCLTAFRPLLAQNEVPQPYLQEVSDGLVYETSFNYKKHHISGLLVMKEETQGYHVLLLAKMGPTLMDFILTKDGIEWKKKIEAMDKKAINKALEKDFRAMLLTPLDNPQRVVEKNEGKLKVKNNISLLVEHDKGKVKSAQTKGFVNLFKSFVTFYHLDDDKVPNEICLTHRNIKLKISLNQIKQ